MDELKSKLLKAIERAPNDEELAKYLITLGQTFSQPKYSVETKTLRQAIYDLLSDKTAAFSISLKNSKFQALTDFFSLTPGLHVIAAPSAHGKTFWAMQWAQAAAEQDMNVVFISLEMTSKDLGARTLSSLTEFSLRNLIQRDYTESQREIFFQVATREDLPYLDKIYIDTIGDYDWQKIYPRLTEHVIKLKPKLIIVDYIQMLHSSDDFDQRTSQLYSEIARELKLFADNSNAAVLLLSQMNREALKEIRRSKWAEIGHVPMSHEFVKESGGIVEAADSVQLVCIPGRFSQCPPPFLGKFQIMVDKSRRLGELGTVLVPFDDERMMFI